MPLTLSPVARVSSLAATTDEVWLACLTIHGEGLETMRIVTDTRPLHRSAGVFLPYEWEVALPDDSKRPTGTVEIRVCNVDRQVTRLLKSYAGIPKVRLEVVLASQPDVLERGPWDLTVKGCTVDESTIVLQVANREALLTSQVPAQTFTPSNSPALWP